jgi:hypothetical protein
MKTRMPRPGDKIHIPLPEDEALRLLLKVKPTTGNAEARRESNEAEETSEPRPARSSTSAHSVKATTVTGGIAIVFQNGFFEMGDCPGLCLDLRSCAECANK